jgi:hypothetical protein
VGAPPSGVPVRYDQAWLSSLLRPFLIALMVACVDLTLLAFIGHVAPFLSMRYVPALVAISVGAALVGCITTTWLAQPEQRQRRSMGYRMAELGLILAVTRLAIWLVTDTLPPPMIFLLRPVDVLLDGLFWVGGFVVTLSWIMATDTTDDLLRMALQPDEIYAIEADRIGEMVRTSHTDRPAILRGLVGRWVAGGILLVALSAGLGLQLSSGATLFTMTQQAVRHDVIVAIVIYFLAGLLLISHGQLAILRSRWTIDRAPSAAAVLRNWPLYVLVLLVAIGLLSAFMPLGGTFWLAQILGTVITFLFGLVLEFFRLILFLLMLLLSLVTGEEPAIEPTPAPAAPPPLISEPPPETAMFPAWAGGALFWMFMALLLGYAAYIYFSGKGVRFGWLMALWRMLTARWRQLRSAYQGWMATPLPTRTPGNPADAAGHGGLRRWRQFQHLAPEQQVRYFYLSLLEHAEQKGIPRQQGETPLQYAPRLAAHLADEMTDREAPQTLTTAFLGVRYAQQSIEAGRLPNLRMIWQQIRQHLRL